MTARATARAAALAAPLVLAGCLARFEAEAPPAPRPLDPIELRLTEAALRAETALTRLARVEADPKGGGEVPRIVPEGLLRRIDLHWTGPLDELVRKLAGEAEYRFETAGAAPARPVMVEIRAARKPLVMVLRDAGLQAGAAAALTVDAERGLVILDWTGGGK